ncbi:hypothetical protein [Methylocella sp.]|uniref:hypothetical protein n=1 Tax=Methylocella sp. TaxID=1978226 RepID=UPI0037834B96
MFHVETRNPRCARETHAKNAVEQAAQTGGAKFKRKNGARTLKPIIHEEFKEPRALAAGVRRGQPPLEIWTPTRIITVRPGKEVLVELDRVLDGWTGREVRACVRPRSAIV